MQILDNKDRLGSLFILAFSIVYLKFALDLPFDPVPGEETFSARTLPVGLAIAAIGFALLQLTLGARRTEDSRISDAVRGHRWRPTASLIAAMGVYAYLFDFLGFIIASFLFLTAGFLILGERRPVLIGSVASGMVLSLWVMLTQAFGLHLDPGEVLRMISGPAL